MAKNILVIEDNATICNFLRIRLSEVGYYVSVAHDGEEGLMKARSFKPDLILLDLMLPKLPGQEVCKAIREDADKNLARTPIIMLTALVSEVDKIIGMVIGANAYMKKPFNAEELLAEIGTCLSGGTGRTAV